MGWSCESGKRSVALIKKLIKTFQADSSSSYFQQSSCHVAHHMVEKAVSFNSQVQFGTLLFEIAVENTPDRACWKATGFCITRKIMVSKKKMRGGFHFRDVDGIWKVKVFF